MAEFHFLRPWWLLALPVSAVLIWVLLKRGAGVGAWQNLVDEALRPHVLAMPTMLAERRWPAVTAMLACAIASIALAGPSWERASVPAFRSDDALVVVLDMSRSMDANDIEPSRLERAKLKLLDVLERREGGQTALVVFSTNAFTVTPLTTDTRTIAAMVQVLGTDIMPTAGSAPHTGLDRAGELLRQAGSRDGEVLMVTDAEVTRRSLESAAALAAEGFRVSVLAVGTEQGGPIGLPGGGFLSDGRGGIVIPALDVTALRGLAQAGGGRFSTLTPDGRDLDRVLPEPRTLARAVSDRDEDTAAADVWLDRGAWLAVLLLPFLALGFRRGWIAMLMVALLLPVPRAEAFEWADLWQRPDQRGAHALEAGDAARAAELFRSDDWRAVALYRAGEFRDSAIVLEDHDGSRAQYNRGNALARAGDVLAAIDAYRRALEIEPGHQDAEHNLALLEELLRENPELASAGQEQEDSETGEQPGDGRSDGDSDAQGEDGESGSDPGQSGLADAGDRPGGAQEQAGDGQDPVNDDLSDLAERAARELTEPPDPAAATDQELAGRSGIDDVEQWASEQAAEQWLRRVPQDPGGLLRRKFELQYRRMSRSQDGAPADPDAVRPW
jgi:Ca-activated chloride channel homolog